MSKPHGWIGESPLGRGSHAKSECGEDVWDAFTIPLGTSDAPVGQKILFPEWVCKDCRAAAAKREKTSKREYAYAVIEAKEHKRFLEKLERVTG